MSSFAHDELLSARAEFEALEQAYAPRVDRMKQYRAEGNRARNTTLDITQPSDYGRARNNGGLPERHSIPLPLGKAVTVKHAFRIAGRLPDVIVDQRDESPQEAYRSDSMEKIAWSIIRASKGDTRLSAASWNASEIGAGCLDLYMDYKLNMPVFRSVDPMGVYEVRGVEDPHDFQRVYRVWDSPLISVQNEYRGKTFKGQPIDVAQIGAYDTVDGVEMCRIVQLCDREKIVRFAMGKVEAMGLYEYQHGYGFTPYVIIPNLGPYEDVWGWADYEFIRAIVEYLPNMLSREADVLRSVAAGSYQESGTGVAADVIAKVIREGGVVSSKRDGKIEPITPAEMPNFAADHGDRVMEIFKMLGFVPDAAWGTPGSGSGTDRGLQLQPLLEYTAMKQLNWQSGLSRLFEMAFRMIEEKMVGTSTYRGNKIGGKTRRSTPFSFTFGQDADPITAVADNPDPMGMPLDIELPRTPRELFDGDYCIRFAWRNMVDPDDPAYVMSEMNKFQQGAQSLETTLENLGVQAPEDEMKRIEKEAERFPWVNQGLVTLILGQIRGNAQGTGGGAPADTTGALSGALDTMTGLGGGDSGALNADAGQAALGPSGTGQLYGGA